MSLYNGPPRPGARGGRDQFNWENVKSDKDREFYLGHSVKASTGRWQKGKDIFWYAKEKQENGDAVQEELNMVKAREEELMLEALGLKPKVVKDKIQPHLDGREMKQLMEGGQEEADGAAERDPADMIKGVGYVSGQIIGSGGATHEMMAGVGTAALQNRAALGGGAALPPPPHIAPQPLKMLRRQHKKAEKKAKKQAKKEAKKAKKEKRKLKQSSSESSDNSEDPQTVSPKRQRREASQSPGPLHIESARARHDSPEATPSQERHGPDRREPREEEGRGREVRGGEDHRERKYERARSPRRERSATPSRQGRGRERSERYRSPPRREEFRHGGYRRNRSDSRTPPRRRH